MPENDDTKQSQKDVYAGFILFLLTGDIIALIYLCCSVFSRELTIIDGKAENLVRMTIQWNAILGITGIITLLILAGLFLNAFMKCIKED